MENSKKKLLLICGCPRSGTTLINFVLNSHPEILISNEIDLVKTANQLGEVIFSKNKKFNKNKITRVRSDVESWTLDDIKELMPNDRKLIPKILKLFCLSINNSKPALIYGDKTPTYYLYDPEELIQLSINSSIYIIHITRNPWQVVKSIRRRTFNSLKGKDYWKSVVTKSDAISHWIRAWNARENLRSHHGIKFLDLNYNALIDCPQEGYKLISNFLEIENNFDEGIISSSRQEAQVDKFNDFKCGAKTLEAYK